MRSDPYVRTALSARLDDALGPKILLMGPVSFTDNCVQLLSFNVDRRTSARRRVASWWNDASDKQSDDAMKTNVMNDA